jgi:chorismate mutase/prephenate dehydratase
MNLEELRQAIDQIDDKIFALLQQRLEIVGKVGKLKKTTASKQYIIRPGREALKVKKAFQQAKEAGFDDKISKAIASIWREMISLSINFEDPAKIALNTANKDVLWLVREYFGPYSDVVENKGDAEIIESLKSKKANIAAFAVEAKPASEPWWLALSKHSEFNIFASLPLFPLNSQLSTLTTLLVSNVTPEPCGEDKFIYVLSKPLSNGEKDNFEVLSEYKGSQLVASDEFYDNYHDKLGARYLGCIATFEF